MIHFNHLTKLQVIYDNFMTTTTYFIISNMTNYFFDEMLEFFYDTLSETDKQSFKNIKNNRKIEWNRKRKILNYVIVASIVILNATILAIYGFDKDNFTKSLWIALFLLILNNIEPKDDKVWDGFLNKHVEDNSILENYQNYQNYNKQQKRYIRARYYVLQKTQLSLLDFQMIIDQLVSTKEIRNEKTRQYRYDEYHYLIILEEMKLRAISDYKVLFRRARLFKIFILSWGIFFLPTLIIIKYSIDQIDPEIMKSFGDIGVVLILVWIIILVFSLLILLIYTDSKHAVISKWERLFINKGWDTFDKPKLLFSDFDTLDKYATFYLQKMLI